MESIERFKITSITYPEEQVKSYYKYPVNALYVRLYGVTLGQLTELTTEYEFEGCAVSPTQTTIPERSKITQTSNGLIEWRLTYNSEVHNLVSRLSKVFKQTKTVKLD